MKGEICVLRILRYIRWCISCALVFAIALIGWQCIDIYMTGKAVNTAIGNIPQVSIFLVDDIGMRFQAIAEPLVICLATVAIGSALHMILYTRCYVKRNLEPDAFAKVTSKNDPSVSNVNMHRLVLYIVAIVFIVLGVMNGGLRDVLVKAIAVCTECIGLG